MENQIFRDINTGLDLNGPVLSIVQQPEDVTGIGTTAIRVDGKWFNSANWKSLKPGGTPVTPSLGSIRVKQDESNTFYIWQSTIAPADPRTYFKKSVDGGETWTDISNFDHRIDSINEWDVNNDVVIVIVDRINTSADSLLYRSGDGCQSWNLIDLSTFIDNYTDSDLGSMISSVDYLGNNTWTVSLSNVGIGAVSTDNGVTWSNITAPYTESGPFGGPSFLTDTSRFGMIGRPSPSFPTAFTGIAVTNLATMATLTPSTQSNVFPYSVAYSSVGGGVLVAAGPVDWWLSEDDGQTWEVFAPSPIDDKGSNNPANHMPSQITTINGVFFAANESVHLSGWNQYNESFWYSTDGGTNWTYQTSANHAMGSIVRSSAGTYAAFTGVGVDGTSYLQTATIPYDIEVPAPSASLIGIATATFTEIASNQGTLAYQWYRQGVGALSDSTNITGTATTTLTISPLITPSDQASYYFTADYVPTYSGVGDPRLGSGYRTGNAPNEPIQSENAIVYVTPLIEVISQPSSVQAHVNETRTFNVISRLSDSRYTDDLQYQWVVNGNEVDDGTITRVSSVPNQTVEQTFTSDGSITVPQGADSVRITLAGGTGGTGGDGWYDTANRAGGTGGLGGVGRVGYLAIDSSEVERTFEFHVGSAGNGGNPGNVVINHTDSGQAGGGGWGGASIFAPGGPGGSTTAGGGAGGGGGATGIRDVNIDGYLAIAGGGAGGGGGAFPDTNSPDARGTQQGDATPFRHGAVAFPITGRSGSAGCNETNASGGGGGGGGADRSIGGDYSGHTGGACGGNGVPGVSGISAFDNTQLTNLSSYDVITGGGDLTNIGNGYAYISYIGEGDPVTGTITISGSKTPSLTLSSDTVGVSTVRCKISSATASNSPQYTNLVNFAVLSTIESANINIEEIIAQETTANLVNINLVNGEYTFATSTDDTGQAPHTYVLYSPDRDLEVVMDLYGGKGPERPWSQETHPGIIMGGFGGYSRIRFTMKQNTEYVISGLIPEVNTPFIYEKARLIACVGEGGHPPFNSTGCGSGGKGGGCGLSGSAGGVTGINDTRQGENIIQYSDPSSCDSGVGGAAVQGQLTDNGIFGSAIGNVENLQGGDTQVEGRNGGRTIQCTKGIYWAQQGISACNDLEIQEKFRLADGTEVTNTSDIITRGFKAGYNVMQTAGAGARGVPNTAMWGEERVGGRGGNGAYGGEGGASTSAGGGGSGFWLEDYGITVLDADTGGSEFDNARVILREWTGPSIE